MVCCSGARTPQRSQTQRSPAQQLHPVTTSTRCFLAFCFCHLLSDQDGKPNVDHDPKPRQKMVEASVQRMARSPIAQVLHKFSQAPGTPINSKPSHSHELSATNHKVIYIKTNNVTHSERMTSHHYHKFTVIEETSNWQISLHAYDEMVSIRENWRTNSAAIFHRCNPFCCNKIDPSTSENVADDIFQILAWDNHAKSTSKSELLKNIRMRTDCNRRDSSGRSDG